MLYCIHILYIQNIASKTNNQNFTKLTKLTKNVLEPKMYILMSKTYVFRSKMYYSWPKMYISRPKTCVLFNVLFQIFRVYGFYRVKIEFLFWQKNCSNLNSALNIRVRVWYAGPYLFYPWCYLFFTSLDISFLIFVIFNFQS